MATFTVCFVFLSLLVFGVTAVRYPLPGGPHHKSPLQRRGPYNIAHRGSDGEFPEATTPAFKRAIRRGADFIQTGIGATKDGVLICVHDLILDAFTDVKDHPEFAHKNATYELREGRTLSGFFVCDFTLEEIKQLRVKQKFFIADSSYDGLYDILTFEDYIAIVHNADRVVGIYPEIRAPYFYNAHVKWADGKVFEDKYADILLKYGYNATYLSKAWLERPVFILAKWLHSLQRVANQTVAPKVLALCDDDKDDLTADAALDYLSNNVVAISAEKDMVVTSKDATTYVEATDMIDKVHAHGLMLHVTGFDNDASNKAKRFYADTYKELDYFIRVLGVDAVTTDFPGTLSTYLRAFETNIAAFLWGK